MRGALLVAAAASLWGLWPLWIREAGTGGAAASCIAFLTAGVLGLPLAVREARGRSRPLRAWGLLALLGLADATNAWFYFRALAEGAVAPGVLSHYLAPVILAVVGPWILREARSPRTAVALVLAAGGTALMVLLADGAGGDARKALILGGASAIFYASATILSKLLAPHFGDAELMIWHALVAAVALVVVVPLPHPREWGWLVVGGVVSALAAGLLFYAGLRRTPVERAGVLTYLEPLCAVLVGWIAYAERPPLGAIAGGVLVVAAGVLTVTAGPPAPPRR